MYFENCARACAKAAELAHSRHSTFSVYHTKSDLYVVVNGYSFEPGREVVATFRDERTAA